MSVPLLPCTQEAVAPDKIIDLSFTLSKLGADVTDEEAGTLTGILTGTGIVQRAHVVTERGGTEGNRHFQAYVRVRAANGGVFTKLMKDRTGWTNGWSYCSRQLKGEGVHTPLGMIGYCEKSHGEEGFSVVLSVDVTAEDIERGCDVYAMHGSIDTFKKRLVLTPGNVMERAALFLWMKYKGRRMAYTLAKIVRVMIMSGKYRFASNWAGAGSCLDFERAQVVFRSIVQPDTITLGDVEFLLYRNTQLPRYWDMAGHMGNTGQLHHMPDVADVDAEVAAAQRHTRMQRFAYANAAVEMPGHEWPDFIPMSNAAAPAHVPDIDNLPVPSMVGQVGMDAVPGEHGEHGAVGGAAGAAMDAQHAGAGAARDAEDDADMAMSDNES